MKSCLIKKAKKPNFKISGKRHFKAIFLCGLIILGSLLVGSDTLGKIYNKFKVRLEQSWTVLGNDALKVKKSDKFSLKKLVAHAGGRVDNHSGFNSLEALEASYGKGFRFIEIDFEWTTDEELVLIHDWEQRVAERFQALPRRYSLEEFKNLKMVNGMTSLCLDDLSKWLKKHPDVFIITDIKQGNLRGLEMIKERFPDLIANFIPQIYYFEEYLPVKRLGYQHIILTLYRAGYSNEAVLEFAKKYHLIAVTMPAIRASSNLPKKLKAIGLLSYAHTINDVPSQRELYANGVFGVYTDHLQQ